MEFSILSSNGEDADPIMRRVVTWNSWIFAEKNENMFYVN
jgi:hypothetical protein